MSKSEETFEAFLRKNIRDGFYHGGDFKLTAEIRPDCIQITVEAFGAGRVCTPMDMIVSKNTVIKGFKPKFEL